MAWISKYDTTFIIFARKRYKKKFRDYDAFANWLFFDKNKQAYEDYYIELEELLREYSNWQTKKVKEFKNLE